MQRAFSFEQIVHEDGYEGVLFPEVQNAMASIGNAESWWHTDASLFHLLDQTGFARVVTFGHPYTSKYGGRRWVVAEKPAAAPFDTSIPAPEMKGAHR
jgi:hypothetical protein